MPAEMEYRVRAVTRFIVTQHATRQKSTKTVCEVDSQCAANEIARGLAGDLKKAGYDAVALPLDAPPPGKVMRCKVTLYSRGQAYAAAPCDGEGKPPGRYTERPWSYERHGETVSGVSYTADPTDPANIVLDGESLMFAAVCPPTCDPNGAEENLIFGQYTPNFNLSCHVRNPDVLASLEQGAPYYVDFTPAPQA